MITRKVLLVILGVVTMAVVGATARAQLIRGEKIEKKFPAFVLESRITHFLEDGKQIVDETTTYAFSDGSWRTVAKGKEGQATEYFFKAGEGFFVVNHQQKILKQNSLMAEMSSPEPAELMTEEELRTHSQLAGVEKILGFKAYNIRVMDEQTGLPDSDSYHAVELGNIPLKVVNYANGKPNFINEPLSITFGEPDASLLKLPEYAVVK